EHCARAGGESTQGGRPGARGAPRGPRAPRLRGVRRAAGHRDPPRRLPARLDAATGARAGGTDGGLPVHAARGDRGAAHRRHGAHDAGPRRRDGGRLPTRGAVGRWVAGAVRAARGAPRLAGLPADRRARRLRPRGQPHAVGHRADAHHHQPRRGRPGRGRRGPPPGRLTPAPRHRERDRLAEDGRCGDRGPGRPARHAPGHPGAGGQHRALDPAAPGDRGRRAGRGARTGPARHGAALRRHRRPAARTARM
ncbi:MAG: Transcriptional regulator, GntR family, in hypothetical Actinobacterial gene cluster, partial [uncultured Nocardioides sp.]